MVLTFAPIFIFLFAPGFYFDPIKQDISVQVLRIMFPYLALISLVALAGGIQNTHQKFSLPALTPVIFNLSLIVAALFIAPKYDMPIYVLAWSVLLAGLLQLVIQIAPLRSIKRLPTPKINFNKRISKNVLKVLNAAIANAENNKQLDIDNLYIKEAYVGKSLRMKRWRPRAKGRAGSIIKPFSNITIIVEERNNKKKESK